MRGKLTCDNCARGDFGEIGIPVVAIELVTLPAFIGDKEVLVPVEVHVDPVYAARCKLICDRDDSSHFFKCTCTKIVVEEIAKIAIAVGDVEVEQAIAVHVAPSGSL